MSLTGTVKFFSQKKGYGFITQPDGTEMFVHQKQVIGNPLQTNDQVTYDAGVDETTGRPAAVGVKGGTGTPFQFQQFGKGDGFGKGGGFGPMKGGGFGKGGFNKGFNPMMGGGFNPMMGGNGKGMKGGFNPMMGGKGMGAPMWGGPQMGMGGPQMGPMGGPQMGMQQGY